MSNTQHITHYALHITHYAWAGGVRRAGLGGPAGQAEVVGAGAQRTVPVFDMSNTGYRTLWAIVRVRERI
jgi:hypothetical protein